mgnify:CR=1 FL=1
MKYLKKWYINLSIQRKILYCTLGVALVVLLAASVSQYMSASSIVTEQTRKQSAGVVNELSVNLDHYFDMVRNSFEYITVRFRRNWSLMNHINRMAQSCIPIIQDRGRSEGCFCRDIQVFI